MGLVFVFRLYGGMFSRTSSLVLISRPTSHFMPHALLSVPRSSHCLTRPALHIAWLSSISARSSPEFGAIHSVFTTRKANQRKDCKSRSQWANKQGISNKAQEQGSINAKLEQLRAAGSYCDYGRVKTLAKELVVNRGYKPDASIYEALILANANPDRGSVQEISRWLQDMEKADVAPDSATYHAALKVKTICLSTSSISYRHAGSSRPP